MGVVFNFYDKEEYKLKFLLSQCFRHRHLQTLHLLGKSNLVRVNPTLCRVNILFLGGAFSFFFLVIGSVFLLSFKQLSFIKSYTIIKTETNTQYKK